MANRKRKKICFCFIHTKARFGATVSELTFATVEIRLHTEEKVESEQVLLVMEFPSISLNHQYLKCCPTACQCQHRSGFPRLVQSTVTTESCAAIFWSTVCVIQTTASQSGQSKNFILILDLTHGMAMWWLTCL